MDSSFGAECTLQIGFKFKAKLFCKDTCPTHVAWRAESQLPNDQPTSKMGSNQQLPRIWNHKEF